MISRDYVIKAFSKDESMEALRVYDKFRLASEKDITVFTNSFLPPNIWKYYYENFNSNTFKVETNGFFQECERRVIAFNNLYEAEYPVVMLLIESNSNFSELNHRDYLGSILSLGIEREKIGDMVIDKNKAYVPVMDDIWTYIYNNLTTIGKTPVTVSVIKKYDDVPIVKFQEIVIIVSSLRIDNFICKLAKISRGKAIDLIETGKVLVDYGKVKSKSQEISKDTRITIRGIGKFIVGDVIGETKSEKQRVIIKKYT
ncbi:RNA-binding protein [Clostridium gasigenes]|uniref:YlmH family RNA-binding protein n=1 Tax=Clostridium gasigenes TaxID=94869 RepID=UPI001C0C13F3|nr:YlmH/Sll1252 family protein [Clostridium gasigenes]MBU3087348.1 RNA-binding protein [Clostridium gasigenes]